MSSLMVLISGRVLFVDPATSPEIPILTARIQRTTVNPASVAGQCRQEQSVWPRKAPVAGENPVSGKIIAKRTAKSPKWQFPYRLAKSPKWQFLSAIGFPRLIRTSWYSACVAAILVSQFASSASIDAFHLASFNPSATGYSFIMAINAPPYEPSLGKIVWPQYRGVCSLANKGLQ